MKTKVFSIYLLSLTHCKGTAQFLGVDKKEKWPKWNSSLRRLQTSEVIQTVSKYNQRNTRALCHTLKASMGRQPGLCDLIVYSSYKTTASQVPFDMQALTRAQSG